MQRIPACLTRCHFVGLVLVILLMEGPVGFKNVDHICQSAVIIKKPVWKQEYPLYNLENIFHIYYLTRIFPLQFPFRKNRQLKEIKLILED